MNGCQKITNDECLMTRNPNDQKRVVIFTAPTVRSTNCRLLVVCNESGRAGGSGDLARIRSYPVSLDTRPNAAATECACYRNVRSSRPGAHPAHAARQAAGFDATPRRSTDCPLDANENRFAILRASFFLLSR